MASTIIPLRESDIFMSNTFAVQHIPLNSEQFCFLQKMAESAVHFQSAKLDQLHQVIIMKIHPLFIKNGLFFL